MSSQPRDPAGEATPAKPKWYSYWPKWRRIMMSGAVILLVGALVPAIMGEEKAPTWLPNATFVLGYGLLAWGFFRAMADRRMKQEWTGETKDGWTHPEDQAEVLEEES